MSGAAVDSRTVKGGELFVPLRAARDGHDWISAALAAGAAAYLTELEPRGGTAVRVRDAREALAALAVHARATTRATAIGVTGSVGKTTTKDMIGAVLGTTYVTHASARSFNNEIGVPLTLLGAPDDAEMLVLELGARAPQGIASLCELARPSVGVVTRVAAVHTEIFGSIEGVQRAKQELVEALPADGTAVLNADDPRVAAMASATAARVITFGTSGDVRAELLTVDDDLRPLRLHAFGHGGGEAQRPRSSPGHECCRGRRRRVRVRSGGGGCRSCPRTSGAVAAPDEPVAQQPGGGRTR